MLADGTEKDDGIHIALHSGTLYVPLSTLNVHINLLERQKIYKINTNGQFLVMFKLLAYYYYPILNKCLTF